MTKVFFGVKVDHLILWHFNNNTLIPPLHLEVRWVPAFEQKSDAEVFWRHFLKCTVFVNLKAFCPHIGAHITWLLEQILVPTHTSGPCPQQTDRRVSRGPGIQQTASLSVSLWSQHFSVRSNNWIRICQQNTRVLPHSADPCRSEEGVRGWRGRY